MRAAFHHPPSSMPAGVARHATGFFFVFGARGRERARCPLPNIANHVVEPVAICGKGIDRGSALVSIYLEVLPGESTLPSVRHWPPLRSKRLAPRVSSAVQAPASGEFPFGFDRQLLPSPGSVRASILVSDVNHRVIIPTVDGAVRTFGMPPIRPGRIFPPSTVVTQIHGATRLPEHHGTGHQERWVGIPANRGIGRALAGRDILCRANKSPKLRIRHRI